MATGPKPKCGPHAQCALGLPQPNHRAEQARSDVAHNQRGRPTERGPAYAQCAHGAACSECVPWHGSWQLPNM
jgi:hypothetical protein